MTATGGEFTCLSGKGNHSSLCVFALQSHSNTLLARTILKEILQIAPSPRDLNLGNVVLQYNVSF